MIAGLGGERLIGHFSTITATEGSQARTEIGARRAKFDEFAHDLASYAAQVAATAQDGDTMPDGMRMRSDEMLQGGPFAKKHEEKPTVPEYSSEHAFHMMLQTCATCHADFRLRR